MAVEHDLYNRFEANKELPDDLDTRIEELWLLRKEVELIGSKKVSRQFGGILFEISSAHHWANLGDSGLTLNHCDNIRHMTYYLESLARADLTNDKEELRSWNQSRNPIKRWQQRRRRRFARQFNRMSGTAESWEVSRQQETGSEGS
jgi:hypothetical protein